MKNEQKKPEQNLKQVEKKMEVKEKAQVEQPTNQKAHRRLKNRANDLEAMLSKYKFMIRMDSIKVEKNDAGQIIRDDRAYQNEITKLKKELIDLGVKEEELG